jgi:hypothetical protein
MAKKALLIFSFILAFAAQIFPQVQAGYTNRFFAAKTAQGNCFVFINKESLTFVSLTGGKTTKTVIGLSPDTILKITDTFIVGKYFFFRILSTLHCYDLDKLTDPSNDGKALDNIRGAAVYANQINDLNSISLYNDSFYYVKNNDSKIYVFSAADGKSREAPGVSIGSASARLPRQVLYTPVDQQRKGAYNQAKKNAEDMIAAYNTAGSVPGDKAAVEKAIASLAANKRTPNDIYTTVNPHYTAAYKYNEEPFVDFLGLAVIVGSRAEADKTIDGLSRAMPPLSVADITAYYKAVTDHQMLTSTAELRRRQDEVNVRITTERTRVSTIWGSSFDKKETEFNTLKKETYQWGSNLTTGDRKVRNIHRSARSLLDDSKYKDDREYKSYLGYYEFYEFIADAYIEKQKSNYKNQNVENGISEVGKNILQRQKSLFDRTGSEYNKDIATHRSTIATLNTQFGNVKPQLDREIREVSEKKEQGLAAITAYAAIRYRIELYDKLKTIRPVFPDYDAVYMNYSYVSNDDRRVFGFRITDRITMSDFGLNQNESGSGSVLVRPQDYALVSAAKDGVYLLTSRNVVSAYAVAKPNILETKILPLTIDEGIFYLIRNENDADSSQYLVTRSGRLLKLSISGGSIKTENAGSVATGDSVLVTADTVYIFSQNGTLKMGNTSSLKVKACNSSDVYTISIRNGSFYMK